MESRAINKKHKENTYVKIKKRSVVWVRASTEKDNNVRSNMLLKLFICSCPFVFQTLAIHYLICFDFFISLMCNSHFSCRFHWSQQNSYLARAPSQRGNVTRSWLCLWVQFSVFAKYILSMFTHLFIAEAQGVETLRNCFELSSRYMHHPPPHTHTFLQKCFK